MTSSKPPILAIVIPIYGHPSLLLDAIESALRQQTSHEYRIVLVNDGCPSPQSDRVCRLYALQHPARILYVHKRNGGLATARNRGVRIALDTWPSVRAVYLLDADNRLHPHVLERCYALLQTDPDAGWIFPDVHMFGSSREFCDTTGDFSRLQLLAANYCEAGSMVRREVFESGVAYDEAMKPSGVCPMGYEDWDFWLQCIAAGFKGRHGPELGFRYRKRPESMLANTERERSLVVGYMRRKHAELYTPKRIKRYEQEEMPRFALYLPERDELILTSDLSDRTRRQSWAELTRDLRRNQTCTRLQAVPPTLVVTSEATLNLLHERGIAANLFWLLEADLEQRDVFFLNVEQHMGIDVAFELSAPFAPNRQERRDCVLCALPTAVLATRLSEPGPQPLSSILEEDWELKSSARQLHLEHLERPVSLARDIAERLLTAVEHLRPGYRAQPKMPINPHRHFYRRPKGAGLLAREILQMPAAPPLAIGDKERHIGFAVPVAQLGDLERIVCNMALETKRHGWRPHLFVLGSGSTHLLAEFRNIFDSIHLIPDEALLKPERLASLFGTLDVVVNNQCHHLNHAQGDLKRLGVKILAHVQLVDRTPEGMPCGHSYLAIDYEHSLHKLIVPSLVLKTFMLAKGFPPEKLLLVPNAPSFEVPPERITTVLAERAGRRADRPLHVLFLGCFGRQDGLDRLIDLLRQTEIRLPQIEWRIVGQDIHSDDPFLSADQRMLEKYLHPPALDVFSLSRHYCWADVLIRLSHYDGAPLSILDAQQFGCVPLATNCGAVGELIVDGETGFLLKNTEDKAALTETTLELLAGLHRDRSRLLQLATQAAALRRAHTWQHALHEWLHCLEKWCPRKEAA
jgi:glycosyltransferase involved in cell wall biosynthesis